LFLLAATILQVQGHSWVACTDYQLMENDSWVYNVTRCKGFARNAAQFLPKNQPIGTDTGYNSQDDPCGQPRTTYPVEFPMATYVVGQQRCLIWPSKNHVANLNNPWIPDGGVKLKAHFGDTDPVSASSLSVVADFGISPFGQALMNRGYAFPRPGFQNCPRFDDNNDKSMCGQCFTVPDLTPGVWTFVWEWEFNAGQYYRTCFEAKVASGSLTNTTILTKQTTSTKTMSKTTTSILAKRPFQYVGVNQAGMEFGGNDGWHFSGSPLGGYGTRWTTPSSDSLAFMKQKGFNIIRLPFSWERLQPDLSTGFNADYLGHVKGAVADITTRGMFALLDPHNYARYKGQLINTASVPTITLVNMWKTLIQEFSDNPLVVVGVMNEPHDMDIDVWFSALQQVINGVRSVGYQGRIMAPGIAWTGAHSWTQTWYSPVSNAQKSLTITDPLGKLTWEMHQYLDGDSSGTSANCVSATIGQERLQAVTTFLRQNKQTAFLGEFAGADNAICRQALDGMLSYMSQNSDVWTGWAWWSAGPWWGNYMFSLEPPIASGNQILPLLIKYASAVSTTSVATSTRTSPKPSSKTTSKTSKTTSRFTSRTIRVSTALVVDRNVCVDFRNKCLDLHNVCLSKLPGQCTQLKTYCDSLC
jgi:endoglucanase